MLRDDQPLVLEIKRKHAALTKLSHNINSTKSALVSALVFPYLLETLLFEYLDPNNANVLYWIQGGLQDKRNIDTLLAELKKIHESGMDGDLAHLLAKHLGALGEELAKNVLPLFYNALNSPPGKSMLSELTEKQCNGILTGRNKARIGDINAQLNIAELFANCTNDTRRKFTFDQFKRVAEQGNWGSARTTFSGQVNIPKVIAVLLGKKLVTDPIMQYFFNNGVTPLPKFLHYKTKEELLIEIDSLNQKEANLKNHARKTERVASYMSFSILLLVMLELMSGIDIPQSLWLVSVCFALNGVMGLFTSTKNYMAEHSNYKFKIKSSLENYRSLLRDYAESITAVDVNNLSDSRVCIKCKSQGDLDPAKVASVIKSVLSRENFGTIDAFDGTIWLPVSRSLSTIFILNVKQKISSELKSKQDSHTVKVNRPLDSNLWHEEIEINKSSSKKNKTGKSIAIRSVAIQNDNHVNVPAAPLWKAAKPGESSPVTNSVKRNQYTLFNITAEKFPNQKCFDKFRSVIVDAPKVVRAVGYQGLVFSKKYGGTLKAKALGEFGDIRVYASKKEISATGDTLYIFDTVDTKAHR